MLRALADRDLDAILARVSRSFYLSLVVLPPAVRSQLSVAYLLARAADTIADTEVVARPRRRALLATLRAAVDGELGPDEAAAAIKGEVLAATTVPEERTLLGRLGDCLALHRRQDDADRRRVRQVLGALIDGMERDLDRFDGQTLAALATTVELDQHCYSAAGCVGEFWTGMMAAHIPGLAHLGGPELLDRGVRLGKALQMVNIIRDAPSDLAGGRCYAPLDLLVRHGLTPEELRARARTAATAAVFAELRRLALEHVDIAWDYVLAIPASAPRLRLACVWPLWIGLATLERLATLADPLDATSPRKIGRRAVYQLMAESTAVVLVDPLLVHQHRRRRARAAAGQA